VDILKTITLQLPDAVVELWGEVGKLEEAAKRWAVLDLVREGKMSSGKAAEILGMTRWDFMELMSKYNVPMVSCPPEEIDEQLKDWQEVRETT